MIAIKRERVFVGNGVSPGAAIGTALKLDRRNRPVLKIRVNEREIEKEVRRFRAAVAASKQQLESMKKQLEEKVGPEHGYILDAHILMLEDQSLESEILSLIRDSRGNAEWAVRRATDRIRQAYASLEDEYFRDRAHDVEDVVARILTNLAGTEPVESGELPDNLVIVSQNLDPFTLGTLALDKVKGLAMGSGGRTSHTAILARGLRLPAVMEVKDLLPVITTGDTLLIDGDEGLVVLNPSEVRLSRLRERLEQFRTPAVPSGFVPTLSRDGRPISLRANTELPLEARVARNCGAEGIGLFRSEFLFFAHPHEFPDMAEQLATYRMVGEEMRPHPVTVRTLDAGADKVFAKPDPEGSANPSMGLRGIRMSLAAPEHFDTQVEAILRASAHDRFEIVLPMVSSLEEVREAKQRIERIRARLQDQGVATSRTPVGAMIEVPAAVLILEGICREVDFLCVGTNDLIQYTLAVDRSDPQVSYLFQPLHPAILHTLVRIVQVTHRFDMPVRICGEISSNPFIAVLLLGMGFRQLSMNPYAIPEIRQVIRAVSVHAARSLVEPALACATAAETADYLVDAVTRLVDIDLSSYVREVRTPSHLGSLTQPKGS